MPLLLSTSWNAFRHTNTKKLIFEIKAAGFNDVELSFNLTLHMVNGIAELVKNKEIRVGSLHNFCPIPEGIKRGIALPDYYSMASADEQQRRAAVKYTQRTIQTAANLNAQAVVLHTGRVEMPDYTKELLRLYAKGQGGCQQFTRIKNGMLRERKKRATPFLNNAIRSLEKLNRYAQRLKIKLGVENRIYYREIPTFEEIGLILKQFQGGNIHYWHDTGHAQVMENLGFADHKDFLKRYGKYLLGIHLHNLSGAKDHQPPCRGEINFKLVKPYVGPKTIKVIEAHYPATAQDLIKSRGLLEEIFDARK